MTEHLSNYNIVKNRSFDQIQILWALKFQKKGGGTTLKKGGTDPLSPPPLNPPLSRRLYKFVENFNILGSEQAGLRKGHSTVYHIFVLYALFEIYVKKRKRNLYCGFVDYSKAFDTMPRVHLWAKLLSQNINGKILDVIRNMYSAAKSFIRSNNVTGDLLGIPGFPPGMPYGFVRIYFIFFSSFFYSSAAKVSG